MIWIAVNTGSLEISPSQLYRGLFVRYDSDVATIWDLRFPRIFIALLGGAALSVSGVLFQACMKNPIADPGIIGISSGAGFASIIIASLFPSLYFFMPVFAFAGGIDPLRIILVGVAVNALFTGLTQAFNALTGSSLSGGAGIGKGKI